MSARVIIDNGGGLILPKAIQDALRVGPGDTLEIDREDDRIILSPIRLKPGLRKELGVWVYRSGTPASDSIPDLIEQQRDQRAHELLTGEL